MNKLPMSQNRDYTGKAPCYCRCVVHKVLLVVLFLLLLIPAHAAGLPDTIDRIRPSIVAVGIYKPSGSPRQHFRGTGFVVGNGHLVVTNHHVLAEKLDDKQRETLAVFSGRGGKARLHEARVLARDPGHDLALLYISVPLPAMRLADGDRVREGTEIAFTGFPIGMALGLYPVTHRGIVSAISPMAPPQTGSRVLTTKMIRAMRNPYNVLQLDATAYPGNSGSPVYDQKTGRVLGVVNSVAIRETKESVISDPSGISYAIPVRFVRELLKKAGQ